ncbi:MAG: FliM/FliN family flagellar motor switch protein [Pseudomonas sp.]|uniref:FliM/FliN family flagellar motor switch protein n=1 Tax=Pseudomonas sp. TaxID=306 RepID=UPI00339AFE8B
MTGHSKVQHAVPVEQLTRLKPSKLGRHYHRVPQYIREVFAKHPRVISDYFLRNYRINLELLRVVVHEQREADPGRIYQGSSGKLGFSIERSLLTEALECYYGGSSRPNLSTPPVSSSEQRLSTRLGVDVSQIFLRAVLANDDSDELLPHDNDYEEVCWEYVVELQFTSHTSAQPASLFIHLDHQLVDELTSRLSGPIAPSSLGNPAQQLQQLPVRLSCVLTNQQLPLAKVLELKVGDILQTRLLERCEVRVNQQKLFRGSLFEEDGCLYLTSLESVEQP